MRKLTKEEHKKLKDMIDSGAGSKQISAEFNVSIDWASKRIHKRQTSPDQYSRSNHRRAVGKQKTEQGFFNEHERENWLI